MQTDGTIPPSQALEDACSQLIVFIAELQTKFQKEFEMKELDMDLPGVSGGLGGTTGGYSTGGTSGLGGAYGDGGVGVRGVGDYLDFGGA